MSSTAQFMQSANITVGFVPVDMQTGANNGDWISMRDYNRLVFVLFKAAGTAGDDPIFKLQQATSNAGAGVKDLLFDVYYTKIGTLTSLATFTRNTQTAATSCQPTSAASQAIICVEVTAANLDVTNNFDHVQLSVADTGSNAQLGCSFVICLEPRNQGLTLPSPIA